CVPCPPDAPVRVRALGQAQLQARLDGALLEDSQVPAVAAGLLDPAQQVGPVPALGDLAAGAARLRDLDHGSAQLVHVTDEDSGLVLARDGEVLAEAAGTHLWKLQLGTPVRVV